MWAWPVDKWAGQQLSRPGLMFSPLYFPLRWDRQLTCLTHLFAAMRSLKFLWQEQCRNHNWASASSLMPPASAFRYQTSQSGTGAFRNQTGFPYSGTGLVPASTFFHIPAPDWPDVGQSGIPAFSKTASLHCWRWEGYTSIHESWWYCTYLLYVYKSVWCRWSRISPALPS